jgi:glycine cleavage system H protein
VSRSPGETVPYRRSRFSTRLPVDRRYTAAHYWLLEEEPGVWRIGFTAFATRMLGDLVEIDFSPSTGGFVSVGQEIGGVEGFKAVTVVYSVAEGEFLGPNEELAADITAMESSPYGRGWLYRVRGRPDPESVDVAGYIALLDGTIDRMLESRHAEGKTEDEE